MQTLVFECDVDIAHNLVLHLPPTVSPGRHHISLLITPSPHAEREVVIVPIPDNDPPKTALWTQLSTLREQAEKEGTLPEPLSWDGVLSEVRRRRGESDD